MKRWFDNEIFQRLFKNAGILLAGNSYAYLLAFISYLLAARSLGPDQFGIFVTIQAYVLVIDRLVNFQSWQALIKYGAEDLKEKRNESFKSLIKFGLLLDLSTAFLGTIIALIGFSFLIKILHWDIHLAQSAWFYCLLILANLSGTPTAILRLFNKFKVYTMPQVITQSLRILCIIIAFIYDAKLLVFLYIWFIWDVANYLILLYLGLRELKKQNINDIWSHPLSKLFINKRNLLKFVFSTNIISSIRLTTRELDILIIGGILGTAAAGLFKMAKLFSSILVKIFDPLYDAIYPELAKLNASNQIREFKNLIVRTGFMTGGGGLILFFGFIIFGQYIINMTLGSQYTSIYPTAVLYMSAIVIAIITIPFTPAILALGKYNMLLIALLISSAIYLCLMPFLLKSFFINGAAIGYILFYIFWAFIMFQNISSTLNIKKHDVHG